MTLIDHRILIPASPEHVWRFVGDLRRNAEWHVNAKGLSMLNSTPKPAVGTRFRLSQNRGRDQVWEVTAWYDRFGYEYRIVEGSPFRQNKGLMRLQETPEGTVVQWTLDYTGGGLFGGAGKAQEQIIVESLQKLYKLITRSKEVDTFQAKSLMRDDPGVEARANYRPRHSTSIPTESGEGVRVPRSPYAPPTPSKPIPAVPTDNPFAPPKPVSEKLDDTRPRPTVVEPLSSAPQLEPDFLVDEPNTPFTDIPSEGLRLPPIKPVEPVSSPPVAPTPTPSHDDVPVFVPTPAAPPPVEVAPPPPPSVPDLVVPTPPSLPVVPTQPAPVEAPSIPSAPMPPPSVEVAAPTADSEARPKTEPSKPIESAPAPTPPVREKLGDTSKLSVFEIFGLPKPSQTQPMAPLNMEALSATGRITALITEADVTPETPAAEPEQVVSVSPAEVTPRKPKSLARKWGKRTLMRLKHNNIRSRFDD